MRLAFGFTILLVGLAFAGKADAFTQPPLDRQVQGQWVTDSLAIGESFFGRSAPCDVHVFAANTDQLGRSVAALKPGWIVDGMTDTPYVEQVSPCAIWLNSRLLTGRFGDLITLCTMLVHELGHMHGFTHDDERNPRSVMNADHRHIVFGCYRRFLPAGQGRAWRRANPDRSWAQRP